MADRCDQTYCALGALPGYSFYDTSQTDMTCRKLDTSRNSACEDLPLFHTPVKLMWGTSQEVRDDDGLGYRRGNCCKCVVRDEDARVDPVILVTQDTPGHGGCGCGDKQCHDDNSSVKLSAVSVTNVLGVHANRVLTLDVQDGHHQVTSLSPAGTTRQHFIHRYCLRCCNERVVLRSSSSQVRRHMNRAGVGLEHPPDPQFLPTMPPPSHFNQNGEENFPTVSSSVAVPVENTPGMDSFAARYPNLAPTIMTTTPSDGAGTAPQGKEYGRSQVQFSEDANLRYQDEAEAYTAYKGKGHFTAHPERTASPVLQPRETESPKPSQTGGTESGDHRAVEFYDPNSEPDRNDQPTPTPTQPHSPSPVPYDDTRQAKQEEIVIPGEFGGCISSVSGMVDKYWNGNRSLLRNPRFIAQLTKLLEGIRGGGNVPQPRPSSASNPSMEREVLRLREELRTARDEKAALREKLISSMSESHEVGVDMDENKMKSALIRAHRDLGIMKGRLQKAMEDNKHLQEHQGNSDHGNHVSSSQLEGLRTENERLKQEVNTLTIRLKQASHMQELANMLQESHKSLVQTNEHLLRDLEAMRQRQDNVEGHKSNAPPRPPHNGHSS